MEYTVWDLCANYDLRCKKCGNTKKFYFELPDGRQLKFQDDISPDDYSICTGCYEHLWDQTVVRIICFECFSDDIEITP